VYGAPAPTRRTPLKKLRRAAGLQDCSEGENFRLSRLYCVSHGVSGGSETTRLTSDPAGCSAGPPCGPRDE